MQTASADEGGRDDDGPAGAFHHGHGACIVAVIRTDRGRPVNCWPEMEQGQFDKIVLTARRAMLPRKC